MSETPSPSDQPPRTNVGRRRKGHPFRLGAVLAVAAAAAVVVWLAVGRSDSDPGSTSPTDTVAAPVVPEAAEVVPISASGLRTLGGALDRPVYWVGARPALQYELTQASDGRLWIRYLPKAAEIGEKDIPYLTVGTYPVTDAFAATSRAAQQAGTTRVKVGNAAIAFYADARPTNVYLAFRGADYQIEVFDPLVGVAEDLVASGKIKLIPGS